MQVTLDEGFAGVAQAAGAAHEGGRRRGQHAWHTLVKIAKGRSKLTSVDAFKVGEGLIS